MTRTFFLDAQTAVAAWTNALGHHINALRNINPVESSPSTSPASTCVTSKCQLIIYSAWRCNNHL